MKMKAVFDHLFTFTFPTDKICLPNDSPSSLLPFTRATQQHKPQMEIIYLIISAASTTFTSIALSLLLPFRFLYRLFRFPTFTTTTATEVAPPPTSYYEGVVLHERRLPVQHSFSYRVRYALFDLDHSPHALSGHLSSHKARQLTGTSGPVFLLTIPPSLGHEHNPLSVYYCYELDGSDRHLKKCIAEVTNPPWGERVYFDFDPRSDLVSKVLHVSPFMDMLGNWRMKATSPGDDLYVSITVQHPDLGSYFTATLRAKRVPASMVSDETLFFWLMPQKVSLWVYWNAWKLRWKGVPFFSHPRILNKGYRDEAVLRDQKLRCCSLDKADANVLCAKDDHLVKTRAFEWKEAKWPWC